MDSQLGFNVPFFLSPNYDNGVKYVQDTTSINLNGVTLCSISFHYKMEIILDGFHAGKKDSHSHGMVVFPSEVSLLLVSHSSCL